MIATPKQIFLVSRMASQKVQNARSESISSLLNVWFLQLREYTRRHKPMKPQNFIIRCILPQHRFPKTGVQRHARILNEVGPEPVAEGVPVRRVQLGSSISKGLLFLLCVSLGPVASGGTVNPILLLSSGETSTGSTPTSARRRQPRHCHSCRL